MTEFAEHYRTDKPNVPITLYEGPITLRSGTDVETADGSIELRWLPDLRIRFHIPEFPRLPFIGGPGGRVGEEPSLEVPDTMEAAPALILGTEMGSHKPTSITGILNGGLQIGDGTALHRVLFRVANFGAFRDRGPVLDRMVWETSEWGVTITPIDGLNDLLKEVKNVGGYIITHKIQVERPDGSAFTSDRARHVGQGLFRWLSFIRGLDVNAILPVGFDSTGQPVWQEWGSWKLHRWKSVLSWADPHHGSDLARAFPGFMRLWSSDGWQKAIGLAIGWYVDSNRNASGLESAIVCAQMALELLAWECLVGQGDAMTAEGFNRLNAPDRVRLMLAHHGIPLEIPATLPEMGQNGRELHWDDIADAVVFVRNKIVHPEAKHRERIFGGNGGLLQDAWTCALWMLELLLLRLFEYDGPYSDRREPDKFVGKVVPVPWSS
jgi:hypothetical protein